MKKKILSFVLALCLIIPTMFGLLACNCGEKEPENTMKLSINPGVTFVLDANDNIINVSYDNEDAGTIYANIDFTNMDVEEAIDTFVEYATISGYVDLTGDEVTIEVNGKTEANITELENKAKAQVESVFNKMNITVTVNVEELSETARKAALVTSAKALAPELTTTELNTMTSEELIKLINDKQEEYKGLAYSQIASIQSSFETLVDTGLSLLNSTYETAMTTIDSIEAQLENLSKDSALYATYNAQLETAKASLEQTKKQIDEVIADLMEKKDELIEAAKAKIEEAKATYKTAFENKVKAASTDLTSHLEAAKSSGKITEDQYNHMISLINDNKAA